MFSSVSAGCEDYEWPLSIKTLPEAQRWIYRSAVLIEEVRSKAHLSQPNPSTYSFKPVHIEAFKSVSGSLRESVALLYH